MTQRLLSALLALLAAMTLDAAQREQPLTLTGIAVGADGMAADFAEITEDCNRTVCSTNRKGEFRCVTAVPRGGAFCIEHPRLGRKRVELDGRRGNVKLGRVQLVPGAVIRVVKPPHVALPARTTISLLKTREPIAAREVVEFEGLQPGEYSVIVAGPEPLQRKRLAVKVETFAEVMLSIDAFRLTGEVEYDEKPLEATVAVSGDAWNAELKTDEQGRFSAELWQPDDVGVSVEASALAAPYFVMKSVSPSDSHWHLKVPSRKIAGRIFDAETEAPVQKVSLQVESDVEGTRATRPIDVAKDGTFAITGAGDGRYLLTARAEGYLRADAIELELREFDGDQSIDVPLTRGVAVAVTVTDLAGKPIADAVVLSDFAPNGTVSALNRTDATGRVVITLADEKPVYILPRDGSLGIAQVSSRQAADGMRIAIAPGNAKLRIEARSPDGAAIPGIGLSLRYAGRDLPHGVLRSLATLRGVSLVTDAAGHLLLPSLPAGPYEVALVPGHWTRIDLVPGETVIEQELETRR